MADAVDLSVDITEPMFIGELYGQVNMLGYYGENM